MNDVSIEINRRANSPERIEGEVHMVAFYWDETFNCYIAEWNDGVCQFVHLGPTIEPPDDPSRN